MILIPAIDLRNGKCVRLHQGRLAEETIYGENPVAIAQQWAGLGAKRLHLVDLDGAFTGSPLQAGLVKQIAMAVKIPVEVGGGIRDMAAIDDYLNNGVDRIILRVGSRPRTGFSAGGLPALSRQSDGGN